MRNRNLQCTSNVFCFSKLNSQALIDKICFVFLWKNRLFESFLQTLLIYCFNGAKKQRKLCKKFSAWFTTSIFIRFSFASAHSSFFCFAIYRKDGVLFRNLLPLDLHFIATNDFLLTDLFQFLCLCCLWTVYQMIFICGESGT